MLFKIIGWLWIIGGIIWFLRPNIIKRHFKKRSKKYLRRILLIAIFFIVGIFVWAGRFAENLIAKILLILAFFIFLKLLFSAKSKAADKIFDWWQNQPLWFWRIYSLVFILLGFLLVRLR